MSWMERALPLKCQLKTANNRKFGDLETGMDEVSERQQSCVKHVMGYVVLSKCLILGTTL